MNKKAPIQYINRSTGELQTETVMGNGALNFAYNTLLGRSLWGLLFNTGFLSKLMGWYYDSKLSHRAIKSLIFLPGLQADEAEKNWQEYGAFNDFFTRKLKSGIRLAAPADDALCSPADGRVLIYPDVEPDIKVPVKGAVRSLENLCAMPIPMKKCSVAVIRLAPVDYHRYHYPCDCKNCGEAKKISGKYHSVNPIAFAKAPDLFVENTRVVTCLESKLFGKFYFIDVGAFGVGSIVNTSDSHEHQKFDEKGFFKFGGSTVILIMDAEKVRFDADLVQNSANNLETLIKAGEQIGKAIK